MQIWVDADACPRVVKDILFRAAQRREIMTTLVANQSLSVPASPWVRAVQVSSGFDVADDHIVQSCSQGDLVITSDIPLAAEVIEKGALVITPRGERFTANNIGARLNMRDFMEEMRSTGALSGGPPPLSHADRTEFANALDRMLARAPATGADGEKQ
jgi:uncharacterized protein YaiI (UPF0178 family)